MNCPKCAAPTAPEVLQKFGGLCPKCLLKFTEEEEVPVFPGLKILGVIGRGGMGIVYKAARADGQAVAVKVLSPRYASAPEFIERFTREAEALTKLSHPNIVAIHSSGVHDSVPYLVMEYVEGTSLRRKIREKALTAERSIEIASQVCDALQFAHKHGIVHRDIKPENILIDPQGNVKIADFGLAKLTSTDGTRLTLSNAVMGTPHYMAPEQLEKSSDVDERADLFSLGVVLYEMLTGELPIGRFKPPSEKGVDLRMDSIVLDLLERDPEDRVSSAKELGRQLKRLDKRIPLKAPPPEVSSKRKDWLAWITAYGTLSLLPALLSTVGALMRGEVSWIIHMVFPAGLALAGGVLAVSTMLLIRVRLKPREGQGVPLPLSGMILSSALLLIAANLYLRDQPFNLDDAWPGPEQFPIYVRLYGNPTETGQHSQLLNLASPHHGDVEKIRRMTFADGRLEVVGIQFRSKNARHQWLESPEFRKIERGWTFREAGGPSIILLGDAGSKEDELIRDGLRKVG